MNRFGLIVAVLQLCAAVEGIYTKNYRLALIYFGFLIGSFAIAWG